MGCRARWRELREHLFIRPLVVLPQAADAEVVSVQRRENALLFVGDDGAQDHHDGEVQDESGRRLAKARLPEGVAGMARPHALLGEHLDPDADIDADIDSVPGQVVVGIETDRGPWIYLSQPGLGVVLGARVLAELGDDPHRYADAKARKNYAGTSPITRQSGKQKFVLARYVHNDRLLDALGRQAFSALTASPAARAYYDHSPPAARTTTPHSANSPTDSSASSTAASRPTPPTTNPSPGPPSTPTSLDALTPWDVSHAAIRASRHADARAPRYGELLARGT